MGKQALLIGSQVGELRGVENDVREVGERLRQRGFMLDTRTRADASRAGILEALDRLIGSVESGDAAVVYYSGHGAYFVDPARQADQYGIVQCLVGSDWTSNREFAGVTDAELSQRLERLTEKTDNVTVILDCCHSSRMMRQAFDATRRVRALPRIWDPRLTAFLRDHPAGVFERIGGNPRAVRIAASERDRFAFESAHEVEGCPQTMGNLSYALVQAFDELGDAPLSWRAFFGRVREQVMEREPSQRPELAGPTDRAVLGVQTAGALADLGAVIYYLERGQPALRTNRILGARANQVKYLVFPRTAKGFSSDDAIATAEVTSLIRGGARVELKQVRVQPEPGDIAIPSCATFPALAVALAGDLAEQPALRSQLDTRRLIRRAEPGESPDLSVHLHEGKGLRLEDEGGQVLLRVGRADDAPSLLDRAEMVSRGRALVDLDPGDLQEDSVRVRWSRLVDGTRLPISQNDQLHVGDHVCVEVENCGQTRLWIALVDVGVTSNVRLLTSDSPQGYVLQPAGSDGSSRFVFGLDAHGECSAPLVWPEVSEPDLIRGVESLVVLVSEDEVDFTLLSGGHSAGDRGRWAASPLDGLVSAVRTAGQRDLPASGGRGARYRKEMRSFVLSREPREPVTRSGSRGVVASVGTRVPSNLTTMARQELCPGDVLLSCGNVELSRAIRGLDGGWYSHCGLWTGEGVLDANDEGVAERALDVALSDRAYLDVYRRTDLTAPQRQSVVVAARSFLGHDYAYGDLFLAMAILGSGSFLFRGSERGQQWWLWAASTVRSSFDRLFTRKREPLMCSELVARSYCDAGVPLAIDLQGLRQCNRTELRDALEEMLRDHLPAPRGQASLEEMIWALQEQYAQHHRAELLSLNFVDGGQRGLPPVLRAGENWNANMVTPRDLMQSPDLTLVGTLGVG